jgi:hypothetical protein
MLPSLFCGTSIRSALQAQGSGLTVYYGHRNLWLEAFRRGRTRLAGFAGVALAEPGRGADGFQRPLVPRSRFQPQLRPSVGRLSMTI